LGRDDVYPIIRNGQSCIMNEVIDIVWYVIQGIIAINLASPVLLAILYFLVPKKWCRKTGSAGTQGDYAIIVTAYEQTLMLPAVVSSILKIRYDRYLVYV